VGTVGGDEVTPVALLETRNGAGILEAAVIEVRQHRLGTGMGHGMGMLRFLPGLMLLGVTAGTAGAADEVCRRLVADHWWCRRFNRDGRGWFGGTILAGKVACQRQQQHGDSQCQPAPFARGVFGYCHGAVRLLLDWANNACPAAPWLPLARRNRRTTASVCPHQVIEPAGFRPSPLWPAPHQPVP